MTMWWLRSEILSNVIRRWHVLLCRPDVAVARIERDQGLTWTCIVRTGNKGCPNREQALRRVVAVAPHILLAPLGLLSVCPTPRR